MLDAQALSRHNEVMRRIVIGIGTTRPDHDPCIACGCAGYTGEQPYPKNLTNYLENVLCWTAAKDKDPQKAIEAATWRIVEKLFLTGKIDTPLLEHIRILIKPRYRGYEFQSSSLVVRSHWLISASNMLLNEV
jgi:hypothetical protein